MVSTGIVKQSLALFLTYESVIFLNDNGAIVSNWSSMNAKFY